MDRRSPTRRQTFDARASEREVLCPAIPSWVKKQDDILALRVKTRQVRPLAKVATVAS